MERTPVESRSLKSIGYDPTTKTLEVEFLSGSVYQHFDVPEELYRDFWSGSSRGKFFIANIRDVYPYKRVS